MKKIIILLLSLTILFSCTKQEDKKQEILPLDNQIVSEKDTSTGSDLDKKQEIDIEFDETGTQNISPEERHKEELIKVTHNNFKPLIESLKGFEKETLENIECESYLYFPELEKRPDYQVDIYKDYLKQCEEIKVGK
ncbi:hypothetical protein HUU51_05025 [Candidatus Gracilibacteria bacterium]|nr:hypothetical protein [Candidatus Gracilibacteria bacterium]